MCGIVGTIYRETCNGTSRSERDVLIRKMALEVQHRGPDDIHFSIDQHACLACNRLTIVGGPNGRQPITNEDGSIAVVCNGEIFNYSEVRNRLSDQGHRFQTNSDCEVIVHLYEEFGLNVAEHLQGQFACGIWDARFGRLLLIRDRFGICPLFWTIWGDRFHFASEIKAIFQDPAVPRCIDPHGIAETALLYSPIPPRSWFKDIWQIPAANQLVLDIASWNVSVRPYWYPPLETALESSASKEEELPLFADRLSQAMQSAVHRRLQGDSPVGLYLSGGLDSSTLAYFAHAEGVNTLFSIAFTNPRFDESSFQDEVTSALGVTRDVIVCNASMILTNLTRAVWHAEAPLFRTAPIPMLLLSEQVHERGYKVVLSGEGSDELFFGYPDFLRFQVQMIFARSSDASSTGRELEALLHRPVTASELQDLYERYQGSEQLIELFPSHSTRWNRTRRLLSLFSREHLLAASPQRIFSDLKDSLAKAYPYRERLSPLLYAQLIEIRTKLSGYLLAAQGDRMSMANAVEQRFPYLDEEVVALAMHMPASMRLRGESDKHILRHAMRGKLPGSITNRAKQGYLAPNDDPIRLGKSHLLTYLLDDKTVRRLGYFDAAQVKLALERARQGNEDSMYVDSTAIYIVSTHLLHLMFVEGISWKTLSIHP